MAPKQTTLQNLTTQQLHLAVRQMDTETVRFLLGKIAGLGVAIVKEPETGLVMMDVSDCFATDFHLGEVLATSAEVTLNDKKGWGMIMGDAGDKALLLACLDALRQEAASPLQYEIATQIAWWRDKALDAQIEQLKLAAATQVSFESMAGE